MWLLQGSHSLKRQELRQDSGAGLENTTRSFRESFRDDPVPTLRPVPSGSFLQGRSQVGEDLVVRTVTEGNAQGPERSVIEKPM